MTASLAVWYVVRMGSSSPPATLLQFLNLTSRTSHSFSVSDICFPWRPGSEQMSETGVY